MAGGAECSSETTTDDCPHAYLKVTMDYSIVVHGLNSIEQLVRQVSSDIGRNGTRNQNWTGRPHTRLFVVIYELLEILFAELENDSNLLINV